MNPDKGTGLAAARFLLIALTLASSAAALGSGDRWFTPQQVQRGAVIYEQNCASCHGARAQGNPALKLPTAKGTVSPPRLDGKGHSNHHGLSEMIRQVRMGGVSRGGAMPPFGGQLDDDDIADALAYTQSLWSDKAYEKWRKATASQHRDEQ